MMKQIHNMVPTTMNLMRAPVSRLVEEDEGEHELLLAEVAEVVEVVEEERRVLLVMTPWMNLKRSSCLRKLHVEEPGEPEAGPELQLQLGDAVLHLLLHDRTNNCSM